MPFFSVNATSSMTWVSQFESRDIPKLVGAAAAYFLIAYSTNWYFTSIGIGIPVIRPGIGFALAVVFLAGRKLWPAIFVGSLISRLVIADGFFSSVLVALGVTGGVAFGALLLKRDSRFDPALDSIQDLSRLILWSGAIGASISALTGTIAVVEGDIPSTKFFIDKFATWWMGDALGIALVAPMVLTWRKPPREWIQGRNLPGVLLYFLVTFLAGQIIFLGWFPELFGRIALGYWMFAFVVWGASRLGIQCAAIVLPMVMVQALAGAASGVGFFGADIAKSQLLNVWFYLLCLSMVGLGLGATVNAFRKAQEEIRHLAHHDPLTGLANRLLLTDRVKQSIAIAKREKHQVAIIFHDLDRFKPVNDTFGHHAGDALLKEVANRLRNCVRESDTVGRIGGDEFVVLLPVVADRRDVMTVAQKIHEELLRPFDIHGHSIAISTSIGIAIFPEHGDTESSLLLNADQAMYFAKMEGRNRVAVFAADMPRLNRG